MTKYKHLKKCYVGEKEYLSYGLTSNFRFILCLNFDVKRFGKALLFEQNVKHFHLFLFEFVLAGEGKQIPALGLNVPAGLFIAGKFTLFDDGDNKLELWGKLIVQKGALEIDVQMSPINWIGGLIKVQRSDTDSENGPIFFARAVKVKILYHPQPVIQILFHLPKPPMFRISTRRRSDVVLTSATSDRRRMLTVYVHLITRVPYNAANEQIESTFRGRFRTCHILLNLTI